MTEREHPPLTASDIVWLPDADAEDSDAGMAEPEEDAAATKRKFNAKVRELEGKKVVELDDEREARKPDGSYRNPFPSKNLAAMVAAFEASGFEFRFNSRSLGIEYDDDGDWLRLDDRYAAFVQEAIAARFFIKTERGPRPLHFGRERWATCLNAYLLDRTIDPFQEWLEALPGWDGRDRLDHYMQDIFGCADGDLEIWVARFIFIGAIQRAFEPGCLMREMPILIGDQSIGKSALTRAVLPPGIPGLHSDGLRWDAPPGKAGRCDPWPRRCRSLRNGRQKPRSNRVH